MAIETKDLNDGTIMEQTKFTRNDKGHTQFSIILPSGRLLESEWLNEDNKKKALTPWLDAVKQAIVNDADAAREEARAVVEEAKAKKRREAAEQEPSPIVDKTGVPMERVITPGPVHFVPGVVAGPAQSMDASSFAEANWAQARKDVDYWQTQAAAANKALAKAQDNLRKWQEIVSQLTQGDSDVVP